MSFNGMFQFDPKYDSSRVVFPWKKWFAWHPVKVKNKRVWLSYTYRRQVVYTIRGFIVYEYGTIFDLLAQ